MKSINTKTEQAMFKADKALMYGCSWSQVILTTPLIDVVMNGHPDPCSSAT